MKVRILIALAIAAFANTAWACPFCGPPVRTWRQRINDSETMVIASVTESSQIRITDVSETIEPLKLKVSSVLKGTNARVGDEIEAYHYDIVPAGSSAILFRFEDGEEGWALQQFVSNRAATYLKAQGRFPASKAAALVMFEPYLEDVDPLISQDAFHHFTNADYEDLKHLKGKISREKIWRRILSPKVSAQNRSLYFTLLSVCGDSRETPMLETLIRRHDEEESLAALLGCYLTLRGSAGLPLVEQSILRNDEAPAGKIDAAIAAIRFVGNDSKAIETARLSKSFRMLLDRPESADLIIADLARWEDWEAAEQVAALFFDKRSPSVVRTPIVRFLRACPSTQSVELLTKLRAIDSEAVAQAESFFPRVARDQAGDGDPGAPAYQR